MDSVPLGLLAVSSIGWAAFAVGFVWNGITTPKQRMSKVEAVEFAGSGASKPSTSSNVLVTRSFRHRWFRGRAWGFSWFDEMSLVELKASFRESGWRVSARYQQFALAIAGFIVGLFGLVLLVGWELGVIGLLVAVAIVLYVSLQLTRAFVRA
jgi:hypothetical protein